LIRVIKMETYASMPGGAQSDSGCRTGDRPRVKRRQLEYCGI
jgi:hypothetical protein